MSAALELAERGYDVIVVEARRVGWGASGRNGGQLVNGYSRSLSEVRKHYGEQAERDFGAMALEGAGIIRERVKKYNIECDLRDGNAIVAMHQAHMRFLRERVAEWRRHGHDSVRLLEKEEVKSAVNSERYVGGYLDPLGGHMHSLNYVLGEAVNTADGTFSTGSLEPIRIDEYAFINTNTPTSTATIGLNLPSTNENINDHLGTVFSALSGTNNDNLETYDIGIVDSNGAKKSAQLNFTKQSDNVWQVSATTSRSSSPQADTINFGGTAEANDTYSVTVNIAGTPTTVTYTSTGAEGGTRS